MFFSRPSISGLWCQTNADQSMFSLVGRGLGYAKVLTKRIAVRLASSIVTVSAAMEL